MSKHQTKKIMGIIMALIIAAAVTPLAAAIPVPHGISGTIYSLDGTTEVPAGIDFTINNTANGFFLHGKTGRGSNGRYAASVAGNDGDSIIIMSWNIEHNSTKKITLDGVTRGVNLLLNMSLKPYPPNITSVPATEATEDILYTYDVEATDYNFDHLTYSFSESPSGMVIDGSGLIRWTPQDEHVGGNSVTVQVSDGSLTANQTFLILVENVNDAPDIISTPVTTATVNQEYRYQVNATDPDNETLLYSLIESPKHMEIGSSGTITWTPRKPDVGNNTIVVQASDGILAAQQLFVIKVKDFEPRQQKITNQAAPSGRQSAGSGAGFSSAGLAPATSQRLVLSEKNEAPVTELVIKFKNPVAGAEVSVRELKQKPEQVTLIQKRVYSYLEVTAKNFQNSDLEEAAISFEVKKSWLDANGISPDNIALSHYSESKWEDLETTKEGETITAVSYQATTHSFSIFAITVKEEQDIGSVNSALKVSDNAAKLREAYAISGFILKSDGKLQAEEKTPFSITNLRTNDTVKGQTGIGPSTGAFMAIIPGRIGDELLMKAGSIKKSEGLFALKGDMEGITIISRGNELIILETSFSNTLDSSITGYVTAIQQAPKSVAAALTFAVLVAVVLAARSNAAFKKALAQITAKKPRKKKSLRKKRKPIRKPKRKRKKSATKKKTKKQARKRKNARK